MSEQLTISALREKLAQMQSEHGDLPIVLCDADTAWAFLFTENHLSIDRAENSFGKKLSIAADYGNCQENTV